MAGLLLASLCYSFAFSEYETTTTAETTTEETYTTENTADSGDGGVAYAGGGDLTVGNSEE